MRSHRCCHIQPSRSCLTQICGTILCLQRAGTPGLIPAIGGVGLISKVHIGGASTFGLWQRFCSSFWRNTELITTVIFHCPVCGQYNVDLLSHVLSRNHFKKLSEVMGEINVHVMENKYWHTFQVFLGTDTGGVAFNHVLGRIRMIRCGSSQPPFPPTPPPSVQRAVCHAGVAVITLSQHIYTRPSLFINNAQKVES